MIFRPSMAWNVLIAALFTGYCKLRGYRVLATPEEQQGRLNECELCDQLTDDRQCNDCGCFVDAKAILACEQCPRRKWLRILAKKSVKG